MGKPQRRFGKEFEVEVVRLVETSGRTRAVRSPKTSASGYRRCGTGWTNAVSVIWKRHLPNARGTWRPS